MPKQSNVIVEEVEEKSVAKNRPADKRSSKTKHQTLALKPWLMLTILIVAIVLSSGVGGIFGAWLTNSNSAKATTQTQVVESEGDAISKLAADIAPSVVSIVTTQTSTVNSVFFGSQDYTTQAAGTGVIISKDGLIITNKHVIPDGTTKVTVVLNDGTEYDNATVVDRDPTNDIAFLKLNNAKNLSAAKIGDSTNLKIGTKVIAVGNALGQFQNTVTAGIISGLDRSITASESSDGTNAETLTGLLQTDAAINSGNSGGPLVTYDGKVIGINTAIAQNADSIGFAIPSDAFVGDITSVLKNGKIEKPYLGVYYTTITKALAKEKNLVVDNGALIGADNQNPTVSGSPADKAGIKSGDIITKVDNISLDEHNTLSAVIGRYQVGDSVKLTILRDGKEITLNVKLEAYQQ